MNGLVGWWKFDEGSGLTAVDSSGQGHGGDLTGHAPTWTTGFRNESLAMSFNGSSQYADYGNLVAYNFERTDTFSGAAWVYCTNISNLASSIFAKSAMPNPNRGWVFNLFNRQSLTSVSLALSLVNADVTNIIEVTSPANSITQNRWYHVAFSYDGSSNAAGVKLYINGVLQTLTVNTNNLSQTMQSTISFTIGARDPAAIGQYFPGQIDDARLYSRVLTATEIHDLYLMGMGRVVYGENSVISNSKTSY